MAPNFSIFPVFVPSKGRANTSSLLQTLKASELASWWFVVEPQDYAAYAEYLPGERLITLPQNDQGIAYVRNYIKQVATELKLDWYWMLDDDVTKFYQTKDRRNHPVNIEVALGEAQKLFSQSPDVAQAALEYQQFAWSSPKPYKLNGYCDVCVCIHTGRTKPIRYRPEANLKEDRDFCKISATSAGDSHLTSAGDSHKVRHLNLM